MRVGQISELGSPAYQCYLQKQRKQGEHACVGMPRAVKCDLRWRQILRRWYAVRSI